MVSPIDQQGMRYKSLICPLRGRISSDETFAIRVVLAHGMMNHLVIHEHRKHAIQHGSCVGP
jgi:hypothetical protein